MPSSGRMRESRWLSTGASGRWWLPWLPSWLPPEITAKLSASEAALADLCSKSFIIVGSGRVSLARLARNCTWTGSFPPRLFSGSVTRHDRS